MILLGYLMVETDIFATVCGGHVTPDVMSSVSYPEISNISTSLKYFHICKGFTDVYSDSEQCPQPEPHALFSMICTTQGSSLVHIANKLKSMCPMSSTCQNAGCNGNLGRCSTLKWGAGAGGSNEKTLGNPLPANY
jgi:hypothetical protein